MTSKPPPAFAFGGKSFPLSAANRHLFYLGATGSGKTVSLRLLYQSFLPEVGLHAHEGGYRAVLYDAKQDLLGQLWQMNLRCPIVLASPFDVRSARWRISADCTSPAVAFDIAHILCPVSEKSAQPFFEQASVAVLFGVLKAMHLRAPSQWELRHVALVTRTEHHLRELLSQTVHTRYLVRRYLQDGKLSQSVLATLDSKMESYAILAALWERASASFSLQDFVVGESILVLGSFEAARQAGDCLNRALMARLSQLLLAQPDSGTRKTLVCFDELREAGFLQNLGSLALRGRSRGIILAAGAQDTQGLEQVYGKAVAQELLGQFGFKAILKLESPDTAQWAASLYATTEVKEQHGQMSRTLGGEEMQFSHGVSETLRERDVVLPNQIMNLPPTSAKSGLHGFYKTPYGSFSARLDFMPLLKRRSEAEQRQLPDDYNFQQRPDSDQYLSDWTPEELGRFGLTPVPPDDLGPRQRSRQPRGINNRGRGRNQNNQEDVLEEREDPDDED